MYKLGPRYCHYACLINFVFGLELAYTVAITFAGSNEGNPPPHRPSQCEDIISRALLLPSTRVGWGGGIYSKGLLVVYFVVLVAGLSWPQWRCDPIRNTLTHLKYVLAAALYRATLDHHCCEAHTRWAFWYQNNADLHFKKLFTHRPTFFAPETWHKRHRQPFKPKD